ncbi:MAG: hypothetical protein K2J81_10755, partial [Treponemataceae bacterium]|nr:hypothetical protein [Treponemataceae bacterium]
KRVGAWGREKPASEVEVSLSPKAFLRFQAENHPAVRRKSRRRPEAYARSVRGSAKNVYAGKKP